jgi:hypothetical protein
MLFSNFPIVVGGTEWAFAVVKSLPNRRPVRCQRSLKTSHFSEQKTAPQDHADAGPIGHVELSNVLTVSDSTELVEGLQATIYSLDDR